MLVQSAIHFALDYLIQTAYRYFGLSISSNKVWSGRRHLLPSAVPLRTQRATFTALGSSLHEGIV
ncbi:hypothetical protein AB6D26_20570 [Vibrio cyclitrophicus]